MFESRITKAAMERAAEADGKASGDAPELRQISWDELAARLAAMRELRDVLAATLPASVLGSFDPTTAEKISDAHLQSRDGLPAINPDALGNSKHAGSKESFDAAHNRNAKNGDRGNA